VAHFFNGPFNHHCKTLLECKSLESDSRPAFLLELSLIMTQQKSVCLILLLAVFPVTNLVRGAEPKDDASATKAFHQLLDNEWQWTLHDDPEFASWLGDHRYDQRWQDLSLDAIQRRHEYRQSVLNDLAKIDSTLLSKQDRISYELFRGQYQDAIEAYQFGWHLVPLTQRGGIQDTSSLASSLRFETVKDYKAWELRLFSFPEYMDQTLALMQAGVDRKIIHARVVMTRLPAQIRRQIVDDPTKSLFYKPFRDMPESIPAEKQEELRGGAELFISTRVVPAYKKMLRFFEDVYLPACFDKVGVWQIPNGKEFYASRCRHFTTTDLTPQQIHDIGLREVARIRGEMKEVMREVGFEGTFAEFLDHLRNDPKYYYKDPNKLLAEYKAICRRIDPQLPKMFGRLPRRPYQLEAIPEHLAPDTTTAYYRSPSADGSRDGTGRTSSICFDRRRGRSTRWKCCLSTRPCRGIICRSRSRRSWKESLNFGDTVATPRSSKAGDFIPKGLVTSWASIKIRTRDSDN
jgi:uncharacterized protein (DUF885 family)